MVSLQSVHSGVGAAGGVHKTKRPHQDVSSVRRDDPDLLTRTSWTNAAVALSQIKKVRNLDEVTQNIKNLRPLTLSCKTLK